MLHLTAARAVSAGFEQLPVIDAGDEAVRVRENARS
jgi:hypothetical protein